jgi:phospholipid N-methyltransferase
MAAGANYRLFWQGFRRTFHTTGAVLPSGRPLCRALARHVAGNGTPRRILEVGPGTGVVTDEILLQMGPSDSLTLVELNDRFVAALSDRLKSDPRWQPQASRVQIKHSPVEELMIDKPFDAIVSGLPLNNFEPDAVQTIFDRLAQLAAPGTTLSFFEYIGVRKFKGLVSSRHERRRLAGVEAALANARRAWQFDRDCVVANVLPAWVHHLRFN